MNEIRWNEWMNELMNEWMHEWSEMEWNGMNWMNE